MLDPRTARPGLGVAIRRSVPSCGFDIRHTIVRHDDSISEALWERLREAITTRLCNRLGIKVVVPLWRRPEISGDVVVARR